MSKKAGHVELGTPEFWQRATDDPAKLAAEVCLIDVANIDQTLQRHASLRAWVNATHEVARIEEEKAEWEHTKAKARITIEVQQADQMAAEVEDEPEKGKPAKVKAKVKPKTVGVIAAEVEMHPDVIASREAVFATQAKRGVLRAMSQALEDRLQMLIQLSANRRAEMKDYNGGNT